MIKISGLISAKPKNLLRTGRHVRSANVIHEEAANMPSVIFKCYFRSVEKKLPQRMVISYATKVQFFIKSLPSLWPLNFSRPQSLVGDQTAAVPIVPPQTYAIDLNFAASDDDISDSRPIDQNSLLPRFAKTKRPWAKAARYSSTQPKEQSLVAARLELHVEPLHCRGWGVKK